MSAYIEVAFINNFLVCLFAYYASAYFSFSKIKKQSFIFFILLEQGFHILCFKEQFYICFYMFELFIYVFLFYKNMKKAIMYICIKYAFLCTQFKLLGGSFHLLHYYVSKEVQLIGIWIVLVVMIILLKEKWSDYIRISDFIYDVRFLTPRPLVIKGYLDTGNSLCIENIPVIFVDRVYKDYFVSLPAKKIDFYTLRGGVENVAYLCEVHIQRYKKRQYYVCCDERILLEYNCRCLLNVEL